MKCRLGAEVRMNQLCTVRSFELGRVVLLSFAFACTTSDGGLAWNERFNRRDPPSTGSHRSFGKARIDCIGWVRCCGLRRFLQS